jgi:hypothetical protein
VTNSSKPTEVNGYLENHARLLLDSFHHWTGKNLVQQDLPSREQARELFYAPFVVLSHDLGTDPLLNYANEAGLHLFAPHGLRSGGDFRSVAIPRLTFVLFRSQVIEPFGALFVHAQ